MVDYYCYYHLLSLDDVCVPNKAIIQSVWRSNKKSLLATPSDSRALEAD